MSYATLKDVVSELHESTVEYESKANKVKFIVNAQLPKRLSVFLNDKGFDSLHTLDLPKKMKRQILI